MLNNAKLEIAYQIITQNIQMNNLKFSIIYRNV